jgi:hypothetical protein
LVVAEAASEAVVAAAAKERVDAIAAVGTYSRGAEARAHEGRVLMDGPRASRELRCDA